MLGKITEITFKKQQDRDVNLIPIEYCIDTPCTLFQYRDSPVFLVNACDEYGKVIGNMIFRWDSISYIREIEPKEKPKKEFKIDIDKYY